MSNVNTTNMRGANDTSHLPVRQRLALAMGYLSTQQSFLRKCFTEPSSAQVRKYQPWVWVGRIT